MYDDFPPNTEIMPPDPGHIGAKIYHICGFELRVYEYGFGLFCWRITALPYDLNTDMIIRAVDSMEIADKCAKAAAWAIYLSNKGRTK